MKKEDYIWAKTGHARYATKNQESYEVSTYGDSRFSALYARFAAGTTITVDTPEGQTTHDVSGRTIESVYQHGIKQNDWVTSDNRKTGVPRQYIIKGNSEEDSYREYLKLWEAWAQQNPNLMHYLANKAAGKVLTDMYANTAVTQARALSDILNRQYEKTLADTRANGYEGNILPVPGVVFVFGSNTEGRHGAGAAKVAVQYFGAVYGQAEGLQGNAYALPTKDLGKARGLDRGEKSLTPEEITASIRKLYATALANPTKSFLVAYRNQANERTLSGYTGAETAACFMGAGPIPDNVIFSMEWMQNGLIRREAEDIKRSQQESSARGGGIFISYYASKDTNMDDYIVQISTSCPKGVLPDICFQSLYPDYRTMVSPHKAGIISDEEYIRRYIEQVLNPNRNRILAGIKELSVTAKEEGRDIRLMCWEKPGDFCHRYLVSNWLNENGIRCEESPGDRRSYRNGRIIKFGEKDYTGNPVKDIRPELDAKKQQTGQLKF